VKPLGSTPHPLPSILGSANPRQTTTLPKHPHLSVVWLLKNNVAMQREPRIIQSEETWSTLLRKYFS
ncbi:MAG: hypothetical protein WC073_15345, partial [Sterolibacterium sp.]